MNLPALDHPYDYDDTAAGQAEVRTMLAGADFYRLANLVPVGLDEVADTLRCALKRIQHRPELVDGCLAETGLVIHPPRPATTSRIQSQ